MTMANFQRLSELDTCWIEIRRWRSYAICLLDGLPRDRMREASGDCVVTKMIPNHSLEPTAVGAVHATSRQWLSCFR